MSPSGKLTPISRSRAAPSAPDNSNTDNDDSYKSCYSCGPSNQNVGWWPPTRHNQRRMLNHHKATTTCLRSCGNESTGGVQRKKPSFSCISVRSVTLSVIYALLLHLSYMPGTYYAVFEGGAARLTL